MLSSEFIDLEMKNLTALGDQLHKEALFAKQFIESGKRPANENSWFSSVREICIYGTFLIKNLMDSLENYKDKSEDQIGFYIGKIAIQSFLEIINAFEQSINNLINHNDSLHTKIEKRIEEKVALIEDNWKEDSSSKSKKLKKDLIRGYRFRMHEMKYIRDTLKQHNVIDDLDFMILEFAWDIRNSMHSNFVAIKDIEFSAPGTSLNYSFKFRKGQELYHPHDLLSFYTMTKQIIFIQLKILQFFNQ